jgi:hypothetical protein
MPSSQIVDDVRSMYSRYEAFLVAQSMATYGQENYRSEWTALGEALSPGGG